MKESNELFELCKQVYKATGWYGSGSAWIDGTPIYSSDYLLEKLKPISDEKPGNQLLVFTDTKGWSAKMVFSYTDDNDVYHFHETTNGFGYDTPLKALLKLTLKLHEEGLL